MMSGCTFAQMDVAYFCASVFGALVFLWSWTPSQEHYVFGSQLHTPTKICFIFEVLTMGISETREEWKQPESSVWKFCAQNGGVVRGSNKAR